MIWTYRVYFYLFSFACITTILLTFYAEGLSEVFMSVLILYVASIWAHRKLLGAGFDENWAPYAFSILYLYVAFNGSWLILKEEPAVFWTMIIFFLPFPIFVLLLNHRAKKHPL